MVGSLYVYDSRFRAEIRGISLLYALALSYTFSSRICDFFFSSEAGEGQICRAIKLRLMRGFMLAHDYHVVWHRLRTTRYFTRTSTLFQLFGLQGLG